MKNIIILSVLIIGLFCGCQKFLDLKPNKSVAVPATLQDMRFILNYDMGLNSRYSAIAEVLCDNYYVSNADWAAANERERSNYSWYPDAEFINGWIGGYGIVFIANTVLDKIDLIAITDNNRADWEACKGEALFFRSFAFFDLAQAYCQAFDPQSGNEGPGIPLRLTASPTDPSARSTVSETYSRIIGDLKIATSLLKAPTTVKTRPSKPAAYALLARVSLAMEKYDQALLYADSALALYNTLIDFNTLNASAAAPFAVYNAEVILHSTTAANAFVNNTTAKIDSLLYASYTTDDLRKTVYFQSNNNGTYGFKGSYNAITNSVTFNGLATDELYLIKAECQARLADATAAMTTLNQLLIKRWKTGTFTPFTAANNEQALTIILAERRKELLLRGLRWQDLRRLNRDSRFAKTLTRIINGQTYTLPPGDLRYCLLIPSEVIEQSGITQNPR